MPPEVHPICRRLGRNAIARQGNALLLATVQLRRFALFQAGQPHTTTRSTFPDGRPGNFPLFKREGNILRPGHVGNSA